MRQWFVASLIAALPFAIAAQPADRPLTDLDRLMDDVVRRKDDNWRKLQQYILNEHQQVSIVGPEGLRLFGFTRDYQWFVKDGFFIRSPLAANGVSISESERRQYEARYLRRQKARDERKAKRDAEAGVVAPPTSADALGDLLRQQSEPNFISAAYFLRFKFEPGRYALAGRERLDGREVLRVEYYPARLFNDDREVKVEVGTQGAAVSSSEGRRQQRRGRREDEDDDERIEQQMNKASLVTLWVLREERQIVRYVFDNVDMGFLPGRSVVRIDDVTASMRMSEPFPGVWLPQVISARILVGSAMGQTGATYDIRYTDYKQAAVTVRVR